MRGSSPVLSGAGPPDSRRCSMTTAIEKNVGRGRGIGKSTFFTKLAEKLVARLFEVRSRTTSPTSRSGPLRGRTRPRRDHRQPQDAQASRASSRAATSPRINGRASYHGNRSVPTRWRWPSPSTRTVSPRTCPSAPSSSSSPAPSPRTKPTWKPARRLSPETPLQISIAEASRQVLTGRPPAGHSQDALGRLEQGARHTSRPGRLRRRDRRTRASHRSRGRRARPRRRTLRDHAQGQRGHPPESAPPRPRRRSPRRGLSDVLREHYDTGKGDGEAKELTIPELTYEPKPMEGQRELSRGGLWLARTPTRKPRPRSFGGTPGNTRRLASCACMRAVLCMHACDERIRCTRLTSVGSSIPSIPVLGT